ncbi:MAG: LysR family transcriptional regulator [Gammaproteobacteria bacterium]|jgi:DNA-binding transcriptional LysR family regulator|nr:LysR family transcriptional regulator [Gammaproteobacteria bacterium]
MRITLRQLSLFVSVAQHQNITQGASAVFLSQPAASMTLSELERQLKKPLFDRLGKRLLLNENGQKLLPKAIEILQRVKELEAPFDIQSEELSGHLKIGASTTIGNYVLPALISNFLKRHPKVQVSLEINNTESIIERVHTLKLDMGFIEGSCRIEDISTKPWAKDEMIVFCAASHSLAKKKKVELKELSDIPWILREPGSGTREIMEKYLHEVLSPRNILLELGSTEAIKNMVKGGLGISCLSKSALQEDLDAQSLVQIQLTCKPIWRDFFQLTHKARYQSEVLKIFEAEIKQDLSGNL